MFLLMRYIVNQLLFAFSIIQIGSAQNQNYAEYLQPVGGITNGTFRADNIISSNAIILQNNDDEFIAGEAIQLRSGFSTKSHTNFSANVKNCNRIVTTTSNAFTLNGFSQRVNNGTT